MEKRKLTDEEIDKIYQDIRDKRSEGQIIIMSTEGPLVIGIKDFIEQPTESILYDLNRDEATTLTLAKSGELESRFINDLAVVTTIMALKDKIDRLERERKGHYIPENMD
jgi:hypothetical protein